MDLTKLAHSNREDVSASGFSFAFQPIVDTHAQAVFSHEALVRGLNNEPASQVINRRSGSQKLVFDAACRIKAIEVAARIGMHTHLNLNLFRSTAVNAAVGLKSTIEAADRWLFPLERIVVELAIDDYASLEKVLGGASRDGMKFAIDDFGAGYSGLILLSKLKPDIVKLNMDLVRGINFHSPRQAIARAVVQICGDLGIDVVAEGVETVDEFSWFTDLGVHLYQGYLFAKPMFEAMPFYSAVPN